MRYYGVSPWEIEVAYGYFSSHFDIVQEEIEQDDPDFVSMLEISIPVPFGEEFFKWFEFRRWEKVKSLFKEMKRRRGNGKAIKLTIAFDGDPEIRFVVDAKDGQWYNNAVEKIDFVIELLPYHLNPERLPAMTSLISYRFDEEANRWRLGEAVAGGRRFRYTDRKWTI